jgi:hypothetical protein
VRLYTDDVDAEELKTRNSLYYGPIDMDRGMFSDQRERERLGDRSP